MINPTPLDFMIADPLSSEDCNKRMMNMKKNGILNKIKGWFRKKKDISPSSDGRKDFIPFNEELVPPEPPEFKTDPERVEAMFQAQAERYGVELDPADRRMSDADAEPCVEKDDDKDTDTDYVSDDAE